MALAHRTHRCSALLLALLATLPYARPQVRNPVVPYIGTSSDTEVSKRWLLWTVVSIAGAFMLVSLYFVWRGFRNWRRYKKALAEESSWAEAGAAGGWAAVERAAGGRQVWAARLPRQRHDAAGAPEAAPPAPPPAGSVLLELPVLRRPEGSPDGTAAPTAGYTSPAAWHAGLGTHAAAPAVQGPRSSAPSRVLAARAPPGSSTAARAGALGCHPRSAGDLESGVGLGAEEPTAVDPELLRRLGLRSLPRPLPGLR